MYKCCICNKETSGYGNNPYPVMEEGERCDECNFIEVLPARISMVYEKNNNDMNKICKRCNRQTGPDQHSGCDQSDKKDCAWYVDTFNKNHTDDFNKNSKEQIKNNQDGKDTFGV